jgi:hypothetical protein
MARLKVLLVGKTFRYIPDGRVLTDFFWDRSPVSIIQGPIGSGTSTACCFKLWKISMEQKPDENGVRRSRFLLVRNTYNDLKETTLKTWRFWFEEIAQGRFGEVKMTNPPNHHVKYQLPDGSTVDAEFIFLALDQEEDVRKLVSLEVTGIWFNEAQFTEKSIFNTAHSRAMQGRYPPKISGGPSWKGVICDLNAPPEGHWIPYMRGDVPIPDEWDDEDRREFICPSDWKISFVQPSGLLEVVENGRVVGYEENPAAENKKWLSESYLALIKGKPKSWIDTYVMNRVGIYRAGRPVFESFRPEIHVSKTKIEYQSEWPLIIGLDFARNPAAVMCQLIRGAMYALDEFGMENVAAGTYAPLLKQRIQRKFPTAFQNGIQFWGDPTGGSKGQATDQTPFTIFRSNGMNVIPAPGNNVRTVRIEAVQSLLDKMVDGGPACLIDPDCRILKTGMSGGYHYAKLKGQHRYHEEPLKDRYSDYCDAFQYACLGAGLGFSALAAGGAKPEKIRFPKKQFTLRR